MWARVVEIERQQAAERAKRERMAEQERQAYAEFERRNAENRAQAEAEWQRLELEWWNARATRPVFEIMKPSQGHERGAHPPGHSEHGSGWMYHPGMMYNEPWHWPPKTKEESMALTQEQFQAALEIRDIVVSAIADAVHSFQEPIDLNEDDSRIVAEGIAEDLFNQGYIALDVVDCDR